MQEFDREGQEGTAEMKNARKLFYAEIGVACIAGATLVFLGIWWWKRRKKDDSEKNNA